MNKKNFIFLSFILLTSCRVNNDEKSIELCSFKEPVQIHTEMQQYYLDYSFNRDYVPDGTLNGDEELSHPEPVKLTFKSDIRSDSEILISKDKGFTEYKTYKTDKQSLDVYNLEIGKTYYWKVKSESVESDVSNFSISDDGPRNLFIDGVTNVRDIGGWKTSDDKAIRQGLLYRGGRLNMSYKDDLSGERIEPDKLTPQITENGITTFKDLNINTEIDFRLDERNGYPAGTELKSVVDGVNYRAIPMKNVKLDSTNNAQIKKFMQLLSDKNNYPIYMHCNIGTDRTGLIAYLLNALLGVREDDLIKDYLFSNFGKILTTKAGTSNDNAYWGLEDYSGDTIQEKATNYFLSIGMTTEEINEIKNIFLE